jgi:hypothetical protein
VPKRISIARLPVTGSDVFGREEDIAFLDDAWANQQVNVVRIGVLKYISCRDRLERREKPLPQIAREYPSSGPGFQTHTQQYSAFVDFMQSLANDAHLCLSLALCGTGNFS